MIDVTTLSLQNLEAILSKMRFYDVANGYLGKSKGEVTLYLMPCSNATQMIADSEVFNAIQKLKEVEKE
jgi:hypothetical protein